MNKTAIAQWEELEDRKPTHALVSGVDLVIVRYDDSVSVLYGRCLHRGALMSDGTVSGHNLICGVHGWDYRYKTGISEYDHLAETLLVDYVFEWHEGGVALALVHPPLALATAILLFVSLLYHTVTAPPLEISA